MTNVPRCPKCGRPISRAATYCAMCGQSLEGITKRGCGCGCWVIIIIVVLVSLGVFFAANYREIMPPDMIREFEQLRQEVEDYLGLSGETTYQPEELPPAVLPDSPTNPPSVELHDDNVYTTRSGYLASLKREWMELGLDVQDRNDQAELDRMFNDKKVVWLRDGLKVRLVDFQENSRVVKVQIEGGNTEFYTTREALVE